MVSYMFAESVTDVGVWELRGWGCERVAILYFYIFIKHYLMTGVAFASSFHAKSVGYSCHSILSKRFAYDVATRHLFIDSTLYQKRVSCSDARRTRELCANRMCAFNCLLFAQPILLMRSLTKQSMSLMRRDCVAWARLLLLMMLLMMMRMREKPWQAFSLADAKSLSVSELWADYRWIIFAG